jgi:glycerol-3-phosphate dehydrogenase
LAHRQKVVIPVIDEVFAMLYESKNPARALQDLTGRELKAED